MANSLFEGEQVQDFPPPTHNPPAPPHELFEISTAVDPSYIISLIRKLLPSDGKQETEGAQVNANPLPENGGEGEPMESCEMYGKVDMAEERNENESGSEPVRQETWEECGCVLWDLSATENHAQLMIQNLILEVLLANLMVSQSSRATEISLGITGNLACHEISQKQIASTNGLVEAIVHQLFIDDVPGLCEALRVMTLCLQGIEGVIWAKALQSDQVLSRILWIAENALNPLLIEKSVGLLLAVLESQQEVSAILLPHMMKLDLLSLLVNLLSFELRKFKGECIPERYALLDLILRTIEALSVLDEYSQQICLNKELLQLLKELIELPDKTEITSSCVTAAVLLANMLTDAKDLALELSQDLNFLEGLFNVFPFASDDTEAQSAIWSICARLLILFKERHMNPLELHLLISLLTRNMDLVEDELLFLGEQKSAASSGTRIDTRVIAMKTIYYILNMWKVLDEDLKNTVSSRENYISEADVDKILDLCRKASSM